MTIETALTYLQNAYYKKKYGNFFLVDKDNNEVDISTMKVIDKDGNFIDFMSLEDHDK